jgi:naphthalene 1,2-dioxygenase ferredoxin reductase component
MDEGSLPPPRFDVKGCVVGLEKVADNVTAMQIAVEGAPLAFAPGQYVALTLPDQKPRDYSLSWRSTPSLLEFFVRDHKAGGASSFIARRLRVDDEVRFDGPFGTMTVDPAHKGPILCLAFSTGIGPIVSIAAAIADQNPEADLRLYWGAAEAEELFLPDDIAAALPLNGQLVLCADDGELDSGIVHPGSALDAVRADFDTLEGWLAYAAGPPRLVEAAAPLLYSIGLAADAFRADAFFTEQDKQKSPS